MLTLVSLLATKQNVESYIKFCLLGSWVYISLSVTITMNTYKKILNLKVATEVFRYSPSIYNFEIFYNKTIE